MLSLTGFFFCFTISFSQENPPLIEFVYPEKNQQLQSDSVTLRAYASDPDDDITRLEFVVEDSVIASLNEGPFEYLWDSIPGGYYYLKAKVYDSYGYMRFDETQIAVGDPVQWRPYLGIAHTVPGRIEAEYFDNGGKGIAYNENDDEKRGCSGSHCRPHELVDIQASGDDIQPGMYYNYFISHTYPGNEWLDYTVSVDSSAWYIIKSRIATSRDDRTFHFELDGIRVTDSIFATNTKVYNKDVWYNFKNIYSDSVYIEKGIHTLKLHIYHMKTGMGGGINFNYFDLFHPDQNPPLIYFKDPTAAEIKKYEGTDILFELYAEDHETDVEKVEIYRSGELYEILYDRPWNFEIKYENLSGYIVQAKAYDTDGNMETSLLKKVIFIPLNTSQQDEDPVSISVFPNPASDFVCIRPEPDKSTSIKFYSSDGKLLHQKEDYEGSEYIIDLTKFETGIYFVSIEQNEKVKIFRIVKK